MTAVVVTMATESLAAERQLPTVGPGRFIITLLHLASITLQSNYHSNSSPNKTVYTHPGVHFFLSLRVSYILTCDFPTYHWKEGRKEERKRREKEVTFFDKGHFGNFIVILLCV